MPELPEVEIIRLGLSKKIIGKKIKNIEILKEKSFQGESKLVLGKTVIGVWRRAKMLGIELQNDQQSAIGEKLTLLFHLKMSGQIIFQEQRAKGKEQRVVGGHPTKDMLLGELPNKSTRVIFEFEDGSKLFFNDQRIFGWIKLADGKELRAESFLEKLGPEPLDNEFSWEVLKEQLSKRRKTPIKVALLDQQVVAGIGNIYASEALFLANIHPKRLVSTLTDDEYKKLEKGIIESLTASIKYGGSSRQHYYNESGEKGYFLTVANVYDRKGLECRVCKTIIEKFTLGGRGTYFCQVCQV